MKPAVTAVSSAPVRPAAYVKFRTVSDTHVVTIPKRLLNAIGWETGTTLLLSIAPGKVVVQRADEKNNDNQGA